LFVFADTGRSVFLLKSIIGIPGMVATLKKDFLVGRRQIL
jgi:hypothetical protein